ncbi:MAG: VWA-like domain-containing protein [Thiotrichales bacterium]|nr:VWA-like domain-containing protein [Thiotrichales bacterium]MCY4284005.1 VWA-like domain-containing protein [Thiotrichales bacterium]
MAARGLDESALRVSDCVTALLRKQPFFGSLVLRLPLHPDPTRETLASDGHTIRYSPQWVAQTAAYRIETAMARVVMACALKHHTRRGDRDPARWQRASQLVTHALIRDAGFTLPPEADVWDGLTVEQAYDRLCPEEGDSGDDTSASPGTDSADADAAGQSPSEADDDDTAERSHSVADEDGDGDNADGQGEDRDGKSRDANDQTQEDTCDAPPSHDPSGTGEVMDADTRAGDDGTPTKAPLDITTEEQAWDEAMHQALSIAKAEGKGPGQVEATIRSAHASPLDWRTLLRRHLTDAARRDYTWSRPNRRCIDTGLYLPSLHSEGLDTLAVILDTSGSLPTETLAAFWAELRAVATEIDPERVVVLQVDTAVRDVAEYTPDALPEAIAVTGRGGTDFRPGFAWLDAQAVRPGVCLYFTDMECDDYPEAEPECPVLWCDYGDAESPWRHPAPWGERIAIGS